MNLFQDYVIVDFGSCKDIFTKDEWYNDRQYMYKPGTYNVYVGPDFEPESKAIPASELFRNRGQ